MGLYPGYPYTAADEEKIIFFTPCETIAFRMLIEPVMFCFAKDPGFIMESPADFNAAK